MAKIPLVAIYLRALFTFCLSFINAGINDFGSCITYCDGNTLIFCSGSNVSYSYPFFFGSFIAFLGFINNIINNMVRNSFKHKKIALQLRQGVKIEPKVAFHKCLECTTRFQMAFSAVIG